MSAVIGRQGRLHLPAAVGIALALAAAAPFTLLGNGYLTDIGRLAFYLAVLAATWSLLAGIAGQFSFAHVAIGGLAAYSGVIWARHVPGTPLGSVGASVVVGTLFGSTVGLALGLLLSRLRGAYLALFTIAFSEVARLTIVAESQLTGGESSLVVVPQILGSVPFQYLLMLAVLVGVLAAVYGLLSSPLGLHLRAMREDAEAAAAMGVNVSSLKLLVIVFTAILVSLAASVYFHTIPRLVPEDLDLLLMSQVIAYAVIGGLESPVAAAVAAVLLTFILEGMRSLQFSGYGVFVLAVVFTSAAVTLVLPEIGALGARWTGPGWLRDSVLVRAARITSRSSSAGRYRLWVVGRWGAAAVLVALVFTVASMGQLVLDLGVWRLAMFGAVLVLTLRFASNGLFAPIIEELSGRHLARLAALAPREVDASGNQPSGSDRPPTSDDATHKKRQP